MIHSLHFTDAGRRWPNGCALLAMTAAALLLVGCGGEVNVPDRPAFDAAVNAYLQQKSMELKILEYRQFTMADDGDSAEAVIALVYAGPVASKARVQFRFHFTRNGGQWQATSHEKL